MRKNLQQPPVYDDCVKELEAAKVSSIRDKILKPTPAKKARDHLIVHFRNMKDANAFAKAIRVTLYEDRQKTPIRFDATSSNDPKSCRFISSGSTKRSAAKPKKTDLDRQAEQHWVGTVPFTNEPIDDFATFLIQFLRIEDVRCFIDHVLKAPLSPDTKSIYFPVRARDELITKAWVTRNEAAARQSR